MGRPGLMQHRKFARLARLVGSRPLARGHLEMLWDAAYQSGDDLLGDAGDVEHISEWAGESGKLASALVDAGFLDASQEGLRVHDLWHHAPEYVASRREREEERRRTKKCANCGADFNNSDARALHCSQACRQAAYRTRKAAPGDGSLRSGPSHVTDRYGTPSPSPSPSPSQEKQLPSPASVAERGAEAPPAGAGAEVHHIRRRSAPRTVDPRHHPLQLALEAAFKQARHEDYGFDGRDARAIRSLLCKSKGDADEVVRRFVVGLGSDYKERVDSIWDLDQRWNALSRPANGVPAPRRELK